MDAKRLASLLRAGPGAAGHRQPLLRVEYNSWHVLSPHNICCPKLRKRRLQQEGDLTLTGIQPAARSQVRGSARLSGSPGNQGWAAFPFSALEAALCALGVRFQAIGRQRPCPP